jgi:hypothetical protein
MQRVYSAHDVMTIGYLQQVLEAAGIECMIRNQFLSGAMGGLPATECWPELWIADESRYDESLRLIDAALAPPARELRDWTCPACGERIERQFGQCWQCGARSPD